MITNSHEYGKRHTQTPEQREYGMAYQYGYGPVSLMGSEEYGKQQHCSQHFYGQYAAFCYNAFPTPTGHSSWIRTEKRESLSNKDTRDKNKDERSGLESCSIPDITRGTLYHAEIFRGAFGGHP